MTTKQPRIPRYRQVADELAEQIAGGQFAPGARLPSVADMAARHGISPGTVDKVHAHLEKEGHVVRRQGSGIFVAPTRLRESNGLIGFVGYGFFKMHRSLFNGAIAQGIEDAVGRAEKQLVLLNDFSAAGWDQVEGVLLFNVPDPTQTLQHLPAGTPCVSLLCNVPAHSSVMADDFGGARLAVEHLLALGHRRVACLMHSQYPMPRSRRAGYWEALRAWGIEPLPQWMLQTPPMQGPLRSYRRWAYESVEHWLRADRNIGGCTALVAHNDEAAVGAVQALTEAGYAVPERFSVIGFDGTEICTVFEPHLTSVTLPLREVGASGVELLLEQIASGSSAPRGIVLPARLDVRHSTGPAPSVHGPAKMPGRQREKQRHIGDSIWSDPIDEIWETRPN